MKRKGRQQSLIVWFMLAVSKQFFYFGRVASLRPVSFLKNKKKVPLQLHQVAKMTMISLSPPAAHSSAESAGPLIRAKLVRETSDNLQACSERLRSGKLVAFPTETVYGLGCHALHEDAVQAVFSAKKRPLTDPLIVHVLDAPAAFALWQAKPPENKNWEDTDTEKSSNNLTPAAALEGEILWRLCQSFWPGPLTLVARANRQVVPDVVMAGTGFVACRSPSHATARSLLQVSQLPLAAPSANKFGHVSPTKAQHVWDDLHDEDVWILEPQTTKEEATDQSSSISCCQVGVESTVAKLEVGEDAVESDTPNVTPVLTVLRQGAVSVQDLETCLQGMNVRVQSKQRQVISEDVAAVAPGQSIRHYSPNIPSYMVSKRLQETLQSFTETHGIIGDASSTQLLTDTERQLLSETVIIDYGQSLVVWKSAALEYRDLSPSANSTEAAQVVFETLRWAERVEGASRIVVANLGLESDDTAKKAEALELAIQDRLTRAASGVTIDRLDVL